MYKESEAQAFLCSSTRYHAVLVMGMDMVPTIIDVWGYNREFLFFFLLQPT